MSNLVKYHSHLRNFVPADNHQVNRPLKRLILLKKKIVPLKKDEEGYDLPDTRYHAWVHQRKTSVTTLNIFPPTDDCHHFHNVPSVVKEKSQDPLWGEFLTIPSPAYKKQTLLLDEHEFLLVFLS